MPQYMLLVYEEELEPAEQAEREHVTPILLELHAGLREAGLLLSPRDAGLMVHAVGLENWQRTHRFCSRCGERTVIAAAGHIRRCPACGAEHYPRTDPAVIMAVVDDADRILLGRQAAWPPKRYSTLAGFVEPGEPAELTVVREIREEVGLTAVPLAKVWESDTDDGVFRLHWWTADAPTGEVVPDPAEVADFRWVTPEEFLTLTPVFEGDLEFFERILPGL
jgi:NAD+ diphosphatase